MVRVPLWAFILPPSQISPIRLHEIKACLVTEQEQETLPPGYFPTLLRGFVTNFGGGHTIPTS